MAKNLFKRVAYPVIDAALGWYGAWRAQRYDLEDTIVVASTGRGGSTWLADILTTLPGYHMLYEPFHLGSNPRCTDFGLDWANYIPPGTHAPEQQAYVERILDGRELSSRTLIRHELQPVRLLQLKGYVVKSINANWMLTWMCECFPVKAVLLVRHPCAVVASQLLGGGVEVEREQGGDDHS